MHQAVEYAVKQAATQVVEQVAKKTAVEASKKIVQKATPKMSVHTRQRAVTRNIGMKDIRNTMNNSVKFK